MVDGEEEDFGGWRDSANFVGCLDAIHHRHFDIQENDLGSQFFDSVHSLLTIFGLTTDR